MFFHTTLPRGKIIQDIIKLEKQLRIINKWKEEELKNMNDEELARRHKMLKEWKSQYDR